LIGSYPITYLLVEKNEATLSQKARNLSYNPSTFVYILSNASVNSGLEKYLVKELVLQSSIKG
jgi:hypothetical protein